MEQQDCTWFTCFVPPPPVPANEVFGFGEFIGAVALLIVFFQIVDIRYRFRLAVLPRFFRQTVLVSIAFIGLGTLTMELWLREGWLTLRSPITPGMWEVIFALLFLATFVSLTYFTFIRPPVFNKRNAERFARALYRIIVKGDDAELAVVADELSRSSSNLISLCAAHEERRKSATTPGALAYDILRMIANRKFCRHVVASAQSTAIALFEDITEFERYDVPIGPFCTAVSIESIENKDSILYHETQEFASDFIGDIKPWTKTIYGDYRMIQAMGHRSPLEIPLWSSGSRWDADRWSAYTRIVLAILRGYADCDSRHFGDNPGWQAIENLRWLTSRLPEIDDGRNFFDTDDYRRLRIAVEFVRDAIEIVDKAVPPIRGELKSQQAYPQDIFQSLAKLMYEVLTDATQVKGSRITTWHVQYNTTWTAIFRRHERDGRALKIVRARLIRLLYADIVEMYKLPNYVGIRVVGLVLNVMGLSMPLRQHVLPCERSIYKFASRWAERNYLKLREEYPDVAQTMLIGSLDFDPETQRVRKTYASWLGKEGTHEYLELDKPK